MTVRDKILSALAAGNKMSTADLRRVVGRGDTMVHTVLRSMYLKGVIDREKGIGKRGGYGYFIKL